MNSMVLIIGHASRRLAPVPTAIMSSIIWHFPQYGLAAAAARDLGALGNVVSVPQEVLDANKSLADAKETEDEAEIAKWFGQIGRKR